MTKLWIGEPKGNCWCGNKGVSTFKGRPYCAHHLQQEQDKDEREFCGNDPIGVEMSDNNFG